MSSSRWLLLSLVCLLILAIPNTNVQAEEATATINLEANIVSPPKVITVDSIGVGTTKATLRGKLVNLGTASSVDVSFGWDTVSHAGNLDGYPNWKFRLLYKDGTSINSLRHVSGQHDLHRLSLGYTGEGTTLMQVFLIVAGYDLSIDELAGMSPGESIVKENNKAVVKRPRDSINLVEGVVFVEEEHIEVSGMPASYLRYRADSKEIAIAFLEQQEIRTQSLFVIVETPEGIYGKDRMGMLDKSHFASHTMNQDGIAICPRCGKSVPISKMSSMTVISNSISRSTEKMCYECFLAESDRIKKL